MTVSSQPRSWAEDLQTCRESRGSRQYATVAQAGGAPPRCGAALTTSSTWHAVSSARSAHKQRASPPTRSAAACGLARRLRPPLPRHGPCRTSDPRTPRPQPFCVPPRVRCRYSRTRLAPFGDTTHPQYTLGDLETSRGEESAAWEAHEQALEARECAGMPLSTHTGQLSSAWCRPLQRQQ